ncbi:glycerol-3-phosphate dehydrogenase [Sandarakinorhabdus cyanobacteriorum]|uniref:Glycerol-3-phosphate dehydrogenase [NAD(P)+] n=1 Tax=Sandarakinorhabdus cyanobacteriorum TaxID=1981098 RepID=A0A255YR25_9SPHN|nr:NAD(P)H-dependent glycerol-3-phosphate dehydrogenase [Sandarakinorhabdus cyanobacteriorum]OYQ30880.1 glycerol-3-phosphate dehydrogenase [Sandarakinorhabdus cyanobacteriorum]
MTTFGIIGGGAWGTALAATLAGNGPVTLWAREADVVAAINSARENPQFLPGVPLPAGITATADLADIVASDIVLVVVPAQHLRATLALAALPATTPIILCAKGIEAGSHKLMLEVARDLVPNPIAVLSGPSFAHEVAAGKPCAITLASENKALGERLIAAMARPTFRLYQSDDVLGAEIGGAVKNVLAIACGVVEGAGLGLNARAALIARGFAEMTRFGVARGARAETLAGLSGLGDLVLTCSSENSRNFRLGVGLGQGRPLADLLAGPAVAEGAATAPVLVEAARAAQVDMPICAAVAALLAGAPVKETISALLARPLKAE